MTNIDALYPPCMDDHLPGSRKPVTWFQRLPERQIEGSIQILDPPCALYEDHTLHNDTPASTDGSAESDDDVTAKTHY
ncbi:hypothetical protein [Roseiflexus sp. RS-1]|uniref:hypothetical protein n=1 Tax=Roseiflexus sp. (strain RS-1) TaxID=357808 RepID=UPI0012EE3B7B|nr:hypothetical protein [Roseiflexus sp. RS-1]